MRTYRTFAAEYRAGSVPEDSQEVFDEAVTALNDHSDVRTELRSYADEAEQNPSLAQRRADAVRRYVIEQSIAAAVLNALCYGIDQAITARKTTVDKAKSN